MENFSSTASFIWSVADLLRGDFKQSQYGRIVLPFTLLRRLECVLEPTRETVLQEYEKLKDTGLVMDQLLELKSGHHFFNTTKLSLDNLGQNDTFANLEAYVHGFSAKTADVFEKFRFLEWAQRLEDSNLLYLVAKKFAAMDLHPNTIDNYHMGLVFEELIRRFAEASNETAGEHFTPRDIVRLTSCPLVPSISTNSTKRLGLPPMGKSLTRSLMRSVRRICFSRVRMWPISNLGTP